MNKMDIIEKAKAQNRNTLTEAEAKGVLKLFDVPVVKEFVAGLFQDEHFGPTIMFGFGGIFTEATSDVVFRVAPIDEN